ncbi:MAG: helix-turn-helix transcriptional regulator [Bacteroidaceae bacterium]|nr:helix-turn-helix transcriptional regulator [Bacteroidaceae bacterium]
MPEYTLPDGCDSLLSIACAAYRAGDMQRAIDADTQGLAVARKAGNKVAEALFLFNSGACQTWLEQVDEGLGRMQKAMSVLTRQSDSATLLRLPSLWQEMASAYIAAERPDSAIAACLQREEAIAKAAACTADDSIIDRQRGQNAVMLATLYDHCGQTALSRQAIQRFNETRYALTAEGAHGLLDYYNSTEQEDAYIETFRRARAYFGNDTVNERYRDELEFLLNAYYWKDDIDGVAHTAGSIVQLTEELAKRRIQDASLEWQERFRLSEAQQSIERERQRHRTILSIGIVAGSALLLIILILLWNGHRLRRKNLVLTRQALRAVTLEEMLSARRSARQPKPVESDETILERIGEWLDTDDNFLQKLTIRDAAQAIGSTQKRIVEAFASKGGEGGFNEIITQKRINRACLLIQRETNYTIEAIAKFSGFPSVRTFYRKFQQSIGLTPTEYRESLKKLQESSSDASTAPTEN